MAKFQIGKFGALFRIIFPNRPNTIAYLLAFELIQSMASDLKRFACFLLKKKKKKLCFRLVFSPFSHFFFTHPTNRKSIHAGWLPSMLL